MSRSIYASHVDRCSVSSRCPRINNRVDSLCFVSQHADIQFVFILSAHYNWRLRAHFLSRMPARPSISAAGSVRTVGRQYQLLTDTDTVWSMYA